MINPLKLYDIFYKISYFVKLFLKICEEYRIFSIDILNDIAKFTSQLFFDEKRSYHKRSY